MDRFETITLATLCSAPAATIDALPYGVIGLSRDGIAMVYNQTESQLAGLPPAKVLGSDFFNNIAQCMNNFLVAQRFADEPELDTIINFVLTLRMRPTPVRLRLLQSESAATRFLLVQRTP